MRGTCVLVLFALAGVTCFGAKPEKGHGTPGETRAAPAPARKTARPVKPRPRPPAPGSTENPLRVGGEVLAPQAVYQPMPDLSWLGDRRIRSQGVPILEAVITAQGRVAEVRIRRPSVPKVDAALVDTVKTWRFRPATKNGKPVAVQYTVTVNFDLWR